MQIPFRQGIVQYQSPSFLSVGLSSVSLIATTTPTVITFAHGQADYLFIEGSTVNDAWNPILTGLDQWLYWDINTLTAERTFGITLLTPALQALAPSSPSVDQHWFDTTDSTMKVWNGIKWVTRIRVFACKLENGAIPISISINSPNFDGTQAGLVGTSFSGEILFDDATNEPLRTSDGRFLTTETGLRSRNVATSFIKTASLIIEAEAQQPISAYTIVKFSDFGEIIPADEFTSSIQQFGIIEENANATDIVFVTTNGIVTNSSWDWSTINTYLYADSTGTLTTTQPNPGSAPVATVVDKQAILLASPQVKTTQTSSAGSAPLASISTFGLTKLNLPPQSPGIPIVVGSNDPRVTSAFLKTGDTMSGDIDMATNKILNLEDPTNPQDAATKQYVDDAVVGSGIGVFVQVAGDTMTGLLTLAADPTNALHAATKQYVDNAVSTNDTIQKINTDSVSLTKGMPVYIVSAGNVARAQANNITKSIIVGFINDDTVSVGNAANVVTNGILTATTIQWGMIVAGGLVEGSIYYLEATSPGTLTTTPPSSSGQFLVKVGTALSSTQLKIEIEQLIIL